MQPGSGFRWLAV